MAQKIAFTVERLTKLAPPATGRLCIYDEKTPGLQLRVGPTGEKVFYVYRKIEGKAVRYRLGRFPELSITDARDGAKKFVGEQAKGNNPAAERRTRRKAPTIGDLFVHWIEHAKGRKKSWRQDDIQYKAYIKQWDHRRLNTITKADVSEWHTKIGAEHGHYTANRALALLRAAYNVADKIGYEGSNPASKIQRFPESPRERFLSFAEIEPFFRALAAEPQIWRDFFVLLLLLGVRRGNLQRMRWDNLDLHNGLWMIPAADMKAKKPLVVPLPDPALTILARRRQEVDSDAAYVFPGRRRGKPITDPTLPWKRICKAAKLNELRPHDLRRTTASWLANAGIGLQVVGKLLGHESTATTERSYSRLQIEPVRVAIDAAAELFTKAGGDEARKLLGFAGNNE